MPSCFFCPASSKKKKNSKKYTWVTHLHLDCHKLQLHKGSGDFHFPTENTQWQIFPPSRQHSGTLLSQQTVPFDSDKLKTLLGQMMLCLMSWNNVQHQCRNPPIYPLKNIRKCSFLIPPVLSCSPALALSPFCSCPRCFIFQFRILSVLPDPHLFILKTFVWTSVSRLLTQRTCDNDLWTFQEFMDCFKYYFHAEHFSLKAKI